MKNPKINMDTDREGWWAIRHNDGWWLGNEKGVICYEDEEFARMAMTIRWQMDGGGALLYSVRKYPGPTVAGGELATVKTAEQAIKDYEKSSIP